MSDAEILALVAELFGIVWLVVLIVAMFLDLKD